MTETLVLSGVRMGSWSRASFLDRQSLRMQSLLKDDQDRLGTAEREVSDARDWQLLGEAKTSARSFGDLFERHRDYVFRLSWGFAGERFAEDVTQEVFTRILKQRRRWVRRAKFTTLLYQVTLNTARELKRRQSKEILVDLGDVENSGPVPPERLRSQPKNSEIGDLAKALAVLSDRQREAVVLRHLEGLSTKETSKVMGCGEGSVKVHLHRGMAALRAFLSDDRAAPD